jgi:hypothetical protein
MPTLESRNNGARSEISVWESFFSRSVLDTVHRSLILFSASSRFLLTADEVSGRLAKAYTFPATAQLSKRILSSQKRAAVKQRPRTDCL